MSEHEALTRFHDRCAARHRKAETRRFWRSRCVMDAQRPPLTEVPIRTRLLRRAGSILRHLPLTYRIVKEI
jgi:hypothetical protein